MTHETDWCHTGPDDSRVWLVHRAEVLRQDIRAVDV